MSLIIFTILLTLFINAIISEQKQSDNFDNYGEKLPKRFSKFKRKSDLNLMGAYLCLSRSLLKKHMNNSKEKVTHIRYYVSKKFPNSIVDFSPSLKYYYNQPMSTESVCDWLNNKLTTKEEKIDVLNFLTSTAVIDGDFSNQEYKYLKEIQQLLKLEQTDLNAIIEKYTKRYEQTKTSSYSYQTKQTTVEFYAKMLEVPYHASFEDIKKSYRKLVMLYHPDKFEGDSDQQKEKAKERFLKIQEAYDYFEKKLNIR